MPQRLQKLVGEWGVVIALVIVVGGAFAVSTFYQAFQPTSGQAEAPVTKRIAASSAQTDEPKATAAIPSDAADKKGIGEESPLPTANSLPPASAPVEKHVMAAAAPAAGTASGDPAAGRQVFRKCQACHSLEP